MKACVVGRFRTPTVGIMSPFSIARGLKVGHDYLFIRIFQGKVRVLSSRIFCGAGS